MSRIYDCHDSMKQIESLHCDPYNLCSILIPPGFEVLRSNEALLDTLSSTGLFVDIWVLRERFDDV